MRMRKLVDEVRPGCLLSAEVGADPTVAKNTLYQDYIKWLENGWLDILFPMAYGYGYTNAVAKQLEKADNKAYVVVGMGIFTEELEPADMQSQTEDYRVLAPFGNDGECYFESSAFLAKGTGEYLANGVYSRRAITPTSDTVAAAITAGSVSKRSYFPQAQSARRAHRRSPALYPHLPRQPRKAASIRQPMQRF